jgi:hypothetical protein
LCEIITLRGVDWRSSAPGSEAAVDALEGGRVVYLPDLSFVVEPSESAIFSPAILASSKNTSFDPASGLVSGTSLAGQDREQLRGTLARFSGAAGSLVEGLLAPYRGRTVRARASFRPAEIAGRSSSWRKDDTRLHVDSFPASPVQGRRILRVFTNVNPAGRARTWRLGEGFDMLAARFASGLSLPWPGQAGLLRALRVTKTRRSPYDALMLQLHDRMKQDLEYQQTCRQHTFDFPPGSTWMAFTDQVSHAAMAGQYQFEQTFLLPVDAMIDPGRSPLRVLEGLKGRALA